ncbi:hypothetical protein BHE74_00041831 [Ensete ventricosum]|nr:hypothetical protein GW17_00008386 [Ensete ventricosum]RWW51790.1 hypothetical protein BHE74_00041831 [Ensete ventricosum]RZS17083.1 hypothetical protein BHM03_00049193 [Ensete ventricosum]
MGEQRLIPAREDEASPHSHARRRTVPPDSGRSTYRYPIGPLRTAHTEWYRSKWRTLIWSVLEVLVGCTER